jgi:hypothetical protein
VRRWARRHARRRRVQRRFVRGERHARLAAEPCAHLWTYRDTTGSPRNGITRLRIEDDSRTQARRITVRVTGRNGVYPVVAGDQPLEAILVLGDQTDAVAGASGESAFVAADCAFNRRATALNCRQ